MSVDVAINEKGEATYKSSDSGVESDGTININAGEDAYITFEPASGQTWVFVDPWIVIDPTGGDITFVSGSPSAVVIQDDNPNGPPSAYTYCLQTSIQPLDPRIINKGN
jgi:hypothetical protein